MRLIQAQSLMTMHNKIFSAKLDHLYEMLTFIRSYGSLYKIPLPTLDQMILAAEEVLVNIINYAYPKGQEGKIEIICENTHHPAGIKIIIKDQGVIFNPIENIPSVLPSSTNILEKSDKTLGGYGIYIFAGLMDCVEYQRIDGSNVLSLTKYCAE